jgi:flagellar motility protein MotE (MotC chaperone)
MKRLIRELRILPVVMLAAVCLLALKLTGIALDGGYILSDAKDDDVQIETAKAVEPKPEATVETVTAAPSPVGGKQSWAQEVFGFPETTGSVPEAKPAEKPKEATGPINPPKAPPDGKLVPLDGGPQPSPGERAVLERLQDRRQELDARSREIDIRENLLKATEKRLEARAQDLKDIEGRIGSASQKKGEAEAARFKGIVTMYENMKAKDAAKIFDRLEMKVLIEVATQMNPRRMSDVLGQMQAEAAERLTVEMASRAGTEKGQSDSDLPKIEGKPNGF